MENLAPAGNWEALERAVAAGADAVYLGYAAFSARATAGNFDEQELRRAVAFAHLHHMRVHVTVNTLVKDAELPRLLEVLRLMNDIPVDAVLVQDLGVLAIARQCFPDLPVHASTQMAIHNLTGVQWCKKMGMTRAVLARECSLKEICKAAAAPIEIEVFGHGAQCVAVSGECLFSSMVGGRSGNRGRCAQPCRMLYTWRGKTAAWLSPRDVCLRDDLDKLAAAGVASVKLEGRLKRPEYVATVASSYRRGIDGVEAGTFHPADEDEKRDLRQIFQRGGFMRGYAMGCEDAAVIDPERVNHGGVKLGTVESVHGGMMRVRLLLPLHDGDGLQVRCAQGDQELIYAGHEQAAGEAATVRLRPDMRVKCGDEVYRLTDSSQLAWARSLTIPAIPVDMTLIACAGEKLTIMASDGESCVTVQGDEAQQAKNRALTEEDARRCLEKTGDTPFTLRKLCVTAREAFVPVSALNALRREAMRHLQEARENAFSRGKGREVPLAPLDMPIQDAPDLVTFRTMEQLNALRGINARLAWFPEDWRENALEAGLAQMPQGTWLQLPTVCEEATLQGLHAFVERHQERLGGVVLGSVGQLGMTWPVPMGAGSGIPVMNRRAAALLFQAGCRFAVASPELTGAETENLLAGGAPLLAPAYGRTQLMLLHHCPARTALGLKNGHAACTMCDDGAPDALRGGTLTDRKGYAFLLLRQRLPEGCMVRLMNALPTDVLGKTHGMRRLVELTDENAQQTERVRQGLAEEKSIGGEVTMGHWNRPVE